jgi:type IV secretory pathway VirB2 component (pilin)
LEVEPCSTFLAVAICIQIGFLGIPGEADFSEELMLVVPEVGLEPT